MLKSSAFPSAVSVAVPRSLARYVARPRLPEHRPPHGADRIGCIRGCVLADFVYCQICGLADVGIVLRKKERSSSSETACTSFNLAIAWNFY